MLVRYLNVLLRLENNVRAYTTETLWMQACLNLIYLLPGFVTQDARAFVLGAVCSFAGVAVFYWRRASKGQTKEAPVRGLRPYAHIYRAALPYGIVLAPAAILIPLYRAICLSFLGNYAPAAEQGRLISPTPCPACHHHSGRFFHLLGPLCSTRITAPSRSALAASMIC